MPLARMEIHTGQIFNGGERRWGQRPIFVWWFKLVRPSCRMTGVPQQDFSKVHCQRFLFFVEIILTIC